MIVRIALGVLLAVTSCREDVTENDGYDGEESDENSEGVESYDGEDFGDADKSGAEDGQAGDSCGEVSLRIEPIIADFILRSPNDRYEYPCISDPGGFTGVLRIMDEENRELVWGGSIVCDGQGMEIGSIPPGRYILTSRIDWYGIVFIRGWTGEECVETGQCSVGEVQPACFPVCFEVRSCGGTVVQLHTVCSQIESEGIQDACGNY